MLKVVGVVINSSYLVEGIEFEGTAREFGEVSFDSKLIRKFISRGNLVNNRFKSNEIDCSNGRIVRINGFRFSGCNLYFLKDNKILKIEDNNITLLRRVVSNNDTVGFDVSLLGDTKSFTVTNTIALSELFKPNGFKIASRVETVRKIDKSGNIVHVDIRKPYLVGTGGNKLSELPIRYINSSEDTKSTKNVNKQTIQNVDKNEIELDKSKYGLYELIQLVKKYDGLVVTNNKSSYTKKSTTEVDKDNSLFVPIEMVEVATPHISFSEKSTNVNLKFRKLGFVYHNGVPITTYLWREKSIFSDGKPNLSKFSVAISRDGANAILKEFGASISVKDADSIKYLKAIESIFGKKDLVLLDIDASNLSFLSSNNLNNNVFYVDNEDILNKTLKFNKYKLESKIYKAILDKYNKDSGVFKAYANLSKEMLDGLNEIGINIKDGSYREPILNNGYSSSDSDKIYISYSIDGMKSLPSVNKMVGELEKGSKIIDAFALRDILQYLDKDLTNEEVDTFVDKYANANSIVDKVKEELYLHKLSILEKNRYEYYDDSSKWNAKKARGNQKVDSYICNEDGLDKLCLTLDNIELK